MKKLTLLPTLSFLLCVIAPTVSLADSKIVVHVDVQNAPSDPALRIPIAGDYTFSFSQKQAQIVLPNGGIMIVDFDKKVVSTLDPKQQTFTQLKLDDYLGMGDKVSPSAGSRYAGKTTLAFDATVGQDGKTVAGVSTAPYNLELETLVSAQSRRSGGGGGGRRGLGGLLGGGIFGGGGGGGRSSSNDDPSGSYSGSGKLTSLGDKVSGELWLASSRLGDADCAELTIAEACAFMHYTPGLKTFADKIRKANLALVAANYKVSIYDNTGQPPQKPPVVSIETKSFALDHFDASLFTIGNSYIKIDPPASPLGTNH